MANATSKKSLILFVLAIVFSLTASPQKKLKEFSNGILMIDCFVESKEVHFSEIKKSFVLRNVLEGK